MIVIVLLLNSQVFVCGWCGLIIFKLMIFVSFFFDILVCRYNLVMVNVIVIVVIRFFFMFYVD